MEHLHKVLRLKLIVKMCHHTLTGIGYYKCDKNALNAQIFKMHETKAYDSNKLDKNRIKT